MDTQSLFLHLLSYTSTESSPRRHTCMLLEQDVVVHVLVKTTSYILHLNDNYTESEQPYQCS